MNLISIVVCTYNQQHFIRRCLDAILSQQCSWPMEVIIGEDGSTDQTRCICEEYVKRFPDIVRLMPQAANKGILQNYFDCVRTAKGKYLMDCGGDDEWLPGRVQTCLDLMEANPDVGMVHTPYITKMEGSLVELPLNPTPWHEGVYSGEEQTYRYACATKCSPAAMAMVRLSMLREAMDRWPQFFSGRRFLMEDLQMVIAMGFMGRMYYHEKPTFYYYMGTGNISYSDDYRKNLRFDKNALLMLHTLTEELPLDAERVMPAMQYRTYVVLMHCFRLYDKRERQVMLDTAEQWGIPLSREAMRVIRMTSNNLTWRTMLLLRQCFVLFKYIRSYIRQHK